MGARGLGSLHVSTAEPLPAHQPIPPPRWVFTRTRFAYIKACAYWQCSPFRPGPPAEVDGSMHQPEGLACSPAGSSADACCAAGNTGISSHGLHGSVSHGMCAVCRAVAPPARRATPGRPVFHHGTPATRLSSIPRGLLGRVGGMHMRGGNGQVSSWWLCAYSSRHPRPPSPTHMLAATGAPPYSSQCQQPVPAATAAPQCNLLCLPAVQTACWAHAQLASSENPFRRCCGW